MQLDDKTLLLLVYLIGGFVLIGLALPLMAKKIKPNYLYGFRVEKTIENPEIWYAVNRYAGKRLFVTGICFTVGALAFYFTPGLSVDAYAFLVLAVFIVIFVIGLIQSVQYLSMF